MEVLRDAATEIDRGSYREVILTGFTDTMGPVDYNDALAARRAAEAARVLRTLVSKPIPIYSRSSRDLEVPTALQVREQVNRRVSVELYDTSLTRPAPTTIR
jgi:outer membrane protein OmpA-like peptidoglycan-associated protein